MSDFSLLLFGIVVFSLMLIGVGFTLAEFRRLSDESTSELDAQPNSHASSNRSQNNH